MPGVFLHPMQRICCPRCALGPRTQIKKQLIGRGACWEKWERNNETTRPQALWVLPGRPGSTPRFQILFARQFHCAHGLLTLVAEPFDIPAINVRFNAQVPVSLAKVADHFNQFIGLALRAPGPDEDAARGVQFNPAFEADISIGVRFGCFTGKVFVAAANSQKSNNAPGQPPA